MTPPWLDEGIDIMLRLWWPTGAVGRQRSPIFIGRGWETSQARSIAKVPVGQKRRRALVVPHLCWSTTRPDEAFFFFFSVLPETGSSRRGLTQNLNAALTHDAATPIRPRPSLRPWLFTDSVTP